MLLIDGATVTAHPLKRVHYAWIVAAVTWLTILAASGFRSTPSTLIVLIGPE